MFRPEPLRQSKLAAKEVVEEMITLGKSDWLMGGWLTFYGVLRGEALH